MAILSTANADDVTVEYVKATQNGADTWRFDVTLRHGDTGWDHYADAWRVLSAKGDVLGTRTLYHPHVDEQPFTRSLSGVKISPEAKLVVVEAHDSVHGWSKATVRVDLTAKDGERFEVRR